METWYTRYAERWAREQLLLKEANMSFEVDSDFETKGLIRLNLTIRKDSKVDIPVKFLPLSLVVNFPSLYPFFRPEVSAPELNLPRHQNIVGKNLCLLDRATVNWLPETYLADFLIDQLPKVLIEGEITDVDILMSKDAEQAEPVSEYYPNILNAPVIFDPTPFDRINTSGKYVESLGTITIGLPTDTAFPSRMIVLESFDGNQTSIGKLPETLKEIFLPRFSASVYRLQERPPHADPVEDYKWLISVLEKEKLKYIKPKSPITMKKGSVIESVIGLTFPEEHSPGQFSSGWLFLVAVSIPVTKVFGKKSLVIKEKRFYYAKANRINLKELSFRIDSLKPLANKKVAIFGLGALGAPSLLEFARNGVEEIRIVDYDTVNAGTTVRWPLGIAFAGMYKTDALEKFVNENFPFTNVRRYLYKVGASDDPQNSILNEILENVSLIYDATAEIGVNHFLSLEARKRKIPYVCIYGTPGVWGGVCLRAVPGVTEGCWMCFQHSLTDGTIPVPPTNREGNIQAAGCGDISFTGASFELANIVSSGVRLALSTMCSPEKGYPNLNADIGILSLVDDHGNLKFPTWSVHKLNKHPNCPYCNL